MPTTESAIIQGIVGGHINQYVNIKKSWSHQSCNAQIRSILNRIIRLETSYTYPCIGRHAPASPTEFRPEAEACAPQTRETAPTARFPSERGRPAPPRTSGRTFAKRPRKRPPCGPTVVPLHADESPHSTPQIGRNTALFHPTAAPWGPARSPKKMPKQQKSVKTTI